MIFRSPEQRRETLLREEIGFLLLSLEKALTDILDPKEQLYCSAHHNESQLIYLISGCKKLEKSIEREDYNGIISCCTVLIKPSTSAKLKQGSYRKC